MNLIGVGVVQSEVDFFDVYGHIVVVVGLHIHSPRVSVAVLLPLLTEVTRLGKKESGGPRINDASSNEQEGKLRQSPRIKDHPLDVKQTDRLLSER